MLNNLSSDELRRRLGENNAAMNTLAEDNQKIVELLARRGLQAIDVIEPVPVDEKNTLDRKHLLPENPDACAHDFDRGDGCPECGNTDAWVKLSQKIALTVDELKAGGWWCAEAGKEVEQELARRNVIIISKKWRQKSYIYGCMSIHPRIASQFVEPEWAAKLRQIHRFGDTFYWGAPSD